MPRIAWEGSNSVGHQANFCGCVGTPYQMLPTASVAHTGTKVYSGGKKMIAKGDKYEEHQCNGSTAGQPCTEIHGPLGTPRRASGGGGTKVFMHGVPVQRDGDDITCGDSSIVGVGKVWADAPGNLAGTQFRVKPPTSDYRKSSIPMYHMIVMAAHWGDDPGGKWQKWPQKICRSRIRPVTLYSDMVEKDKSSPKTVRNYPPPPIRPLPDLKATTWTKFTPGAVLPKGSDPKFAKAQPIHSFRTKFVGMGCTGENGEVVNCRFGGMAQELSQLSWRGNLRRDHPFTAQQFNLWKNYLRNNKISPGLPPGITINPDTGVIDGQGSFFTLFQFMNDGLLNFNWGTYVELHIMSKNAGGETATPIRIRFLNMGTESKKSNDMAQFPQMDYLYWFWHGGKKYFCPCDIPDNVPPDANSHLIGQAKAWKGRWKVLPTLDGRDYCGNQRIHL